MAKLLRKKKKRTKLPADEQTIAEKTCVLAEKQATEKQTAKKQQASKVVNKNRSSCVTSEDLEQAFSSLPLNVTRKIGAAGVSPVVNDILGAIYAVDPSGTPTYTVLYNALVNFDEYSGCKFSNSQNTDSISWANDAYWEVRAALTKENKKKKSQERRDAKKGILGAAPVAGLSPLQVRRRLRRSKPLAPVCDESPKPAAKRSAPSSPCLAGRTNESPGPVAKRSVPPSPCLAERASGSPGAAAKRSVPSSPCLAERSNESPGPAAKRSKPSSPSCVDAESNPGFRAMQIPANIPENVVFAMLEAQAQAQAMTSGAGIGVFSDNEYDASDSDSDGPEDQKAKTKKVTKQKATHAKKPDDVKKRPSAAGAGMKLPKGWKIDTVERKSGATKGVKDTYYIAPDGTRCRSPKEVIEHLASI